ncbi:MAG: sulfur carrier protein ThiS [Alicyclobacillaceae bacterium]|nr:sulfur carrier protein ThiS [Alicyclobacillaceae bacterium]
MEVRLNGQPRQVPDGIDIRRLLEQFGLARERVAVEVNGQIVPRERFAEHVLQAGDTVEVVRFVGGG